jgi:hypothetical protein
MSRIPRCIINATNTHTDYVILIPFPVQQRSHKPAPVLRYDILPVSFFIQKEETEITFYGYEFNIQGDWNMTKLRRSYRPLKGFRLI